MSVWDTLIGLTATALKNKPRSDVLDALLELRAAMHACNKTYSDFVNVVKLGDYYSQISERKMLAAPESGLKVYDPRREWGDSVTRLNYALDSISMTLRVLTPKALEKLSQYAETEASLEELVSEEEDPSMKAATEEQVPEEEDLSEAAREELVPEEERYGWPITVLNKYGARIDLRDRHVFRLSFKRAVEQLDAFIRANFKPEELFQAAKRVHEWPYPYVFCGEYWLKYAR